MSTLDKEHVFDGSIEEVFHGITRYEKYPKYLPGVTKIILEPSTNKKAVTRVRYELNIIKTFFYTLEMFEDNPKKIWWELVDSNLMKANSGSWNFEKMAQHQTKATYSLDITFKGLVPRAITDQIAKANLPLMFSGFQRLIDDSRAK